ncbi:DUF2851 family protein [Bacteroidota bacterium]
MKLKEDLLYHIWQYRLFELPLMDMDEEIVELVDPGQQNHDAGPDFFNARIRSGYILWAGNVEIHRKASEWYQHGHHLDRAFDNVILHVVLDPDCQVCNSRGREIRTVRMGIPPGIRMRYELLMENHDFIPCWQTLDSIDRGRMNIWLERLLVERMEERMARIAEVQKSCGGDWEEILYVIMARAFGQKVNADPFEMLARSVPRKQILQHCPDLMSKEAILFGQAGMLEVENSQDPYYSELQAQYRILKDKMGLKPIDGFLLKFLRLRPDNFPTIRISQLACYLENYSDLFSRLNDHEDPLAMALKMELIASEYWTSHYRFQRESPPKQKRLGKNRINGLYINAILPVILTFSPKSSKSLNLCEFPGNPHRIPAEDNRIIRMWRGLGLEVPDVFYSQALLQLTNNYCKFRRCLSCYVGSKIIQSSHREK